MSALSSHRGYVRIVLISSKGRDDLRQPLILAIAWHIQKIVHADGSAAAADLLRLKTDALYPITNNVFFIGWPISDQAVFI